MSAELEALGRIESKVDGVASDVSDVRERVAAVETALEGERTVARVLAKQCTERHDTIKDHRAEDTGKTREVDERVKGLEERQDHMDGAGVLARALFAVVVTLPGFVALALQFTGCGLE